MPVLIFIASLGSYIYLLNPTIAPVNGGEFAAAANVLGIPHAPGYPLFVLLGKIFTLLLPFGNIAYRTNFMSTFFMALSNALFYKIILHLFQNRILAATGAVLFWSSHALLAVAVTTDSLSLNVFLAVLLIYLVLTHKSLPFLVLTFSLGLGNHHTILLILPALAAYYYWTYEKGSLQKHLKPAAICLMIGLSIQIYLPLRAHQNPPINYGDPKSWSAFVHLVTRQDYGSAQMAAAAPVKVETLQILQSAAKFTFAKIKNNYSIAGIILCLLGFFGLLFTKRPVGLFWLIYFAVPFLILTRLSRSPASGLPMWEADPFSMEAFERMTTLWFPAICIWIIAGAHILLEALHRFFPIRIARIGLGGILAIGSFLIAARPAWTNANCRHSFFAYDYGKNVLRSMPLESFFFLPGDIAYFSGLYLQHVEKLRPDIKFIPQFLLEAPWARPVVSRSWPQLAPTNNKLPMSQYAETFIKNASKDYPVLIEPRSLIKAPINFQPLRLWPYGIFEMVKETPPSDEQSGSPLHLLVIRGQKSSAQTRDAFNREIFLYYAGAHADWAGFLEKRDAKAALRFWYRAWSLFPNIPEIAFRLGIHFFSNGQLQKAEFWFKKALELDPNNKNYIKASALIRH